MAQIAINIPDAQLQAVLDAWALEYGYTATTDGLPNPETKQQFFRRVLIEQVKKVARKNYIPPDVGIT